MVWATAIHRNNQQTSTMESYHPMQQLPVYVKGPSLKKDSVQKMIIPAMIVAQCSLIFPVSGKLQKDVSLLSFNAKSANCIASVIIFVSSIILVSIPFFEYWNDRTISYDLARRVVYSITSALYMGAFISLARKWKDVMLNWEAVEGRMENFTPVNVTRKITVSTIFFMLFSLGEHILSYQFENSFLLRDHFKWTYRQLFIWTEFAMWKGYLAAIINFHMMLAWNFADLFLGVISMTLCSAFDRFNLELENAIGNRVKTIAYWRTMRETYNLLRLLTRFLNETLSLFVTVSFVNNLFFICLQLLSSLKLMGLTKTLYFSVSFGHLLFRTCFVCYTAAGIYESSKKPIKLLFTLPSENYNSEVHRLLLSVITDQITLSGCNFFYITKSLLLKVAGTILTCEIILIQLETMKAHAGQN